MIRSSQRYQQLPAGLSIVSGTPKPRVPRRPRHAFNIQQRPYELTPFFIAPVLAGETLKNMLLQARIVSTAVKSKLIGAHIEHYFFYVKLRDLADATDIVEMLMDTGGTSIDLASADNAYYNVKQNAPKWLEMCTTAVVKHFFRDEGDTASHVGSVTGLPMVQWENKNSVIESLIDDADIVTDDVTDAQAFPDHEKAYQSWEWMRQMQLTEMTFEDYLGSFGVQLTAQESGKPELIRMTKNWTYPTNTVDGDGTINTQFSWSVQERADKDRFFKEPGFLVGYTVLRPKLYLGNKKQSAVSLMNTALTWLPATAKDMVQTSLVKMLGSSANSPFTNATTPTNGELDSENSYWLDVRDLFVYGDEFTNRTLDSTINACRAEDLTDFHGKKYPHSASLQALGVTSYTADSDGIVSLNVLGTQVDMT